MSEVFRGLTPDGLLPTAAQAQVQTMIEAEVDPLAAITITGAGRPDQPATLTTPGTATAVSGAANGTVFRSLDGAGVGAWEWAKRGGSWVVTSGDTGWYSIASSLAPGWRAMAHFVACLTAETVYVNARLGVTTALTGARSTATPVTNNLPVEVRPAGAVGFTNLMGVVLENSQSGPAAGVIGTSLDARRLDVKVLGGGDWTTPGAGDWSTDDRLGFQVSWPRAASQPWPTTL